MKVTVTKFTITLQHGMYLNAVVKTVTLSKCKFLNYIYFDYVFNKLYTLDMILSKNDHFLNYECFRLNWTSTIINQKEQLNYNEQYCYLKNWGKYNKWVLRCNKTR